jgi:hypothetical protein
MAAGLGFIEFSTGDILTAASANGYLASQTVMVFANAAARTSAITSPQEGMISYLKDTDATQYYSGSAWATIGAGSSGGMTLLQTLTLSGTSTTSSSLSASYKSLVLHFYGVTTTINGSINIRVNSNTGANYGDAYLSDSNTTFSINAAATSVRMLDYNTSGTNYSSGIVEIPQYANTSATTKALVSFQTNTAARRTFNIGYITESAAISTLTFLTGSTPTMGGTVLIYGVN